MIYNELSRIQKTILHIKSFFVLPKKGIMVCRKCGFKSEYLSSDIVFSENGITTHQHYNDGWIVYDIDRDNDSTILYFYRRKIIAVYRCPICRTYKDKTYSYFLSGRKLDRLINSARSRHSN